MRSARQCAELASLWLKSELAMLKYAAAILRAKLPTGVKRAAICFGWRLKKNIKGIGANIRKSGLPVDPSLPDAPAAMRRYAQAGGEADEAYAMRVAAMIMEGPGNCRFMT